MIKAFTKIFSIGTDYIQDIFLEEVEITEKIDGSQFCFGKIDDELYLRSKGAQMFAETPVKMFKKGIEYVVSIQDKIPDNYVFYCEYLNNPKHNILKYDRVPKNNIILFGVSDGTGTKFDGELKKWADFLDIENVPVIFKGKINSAEEIKNLMKESILGGTEMEGIVVKNYQRPFLLGGQPIPLMAGKYVSEKFKETHREKWGSENTSKGKFKTFCDSFKTEARWEKSIQHLKEKEELENSPRDIGKLLKEINIDIETEEKDNIKNFLYNEFRREILATATKGFPEWYKNRLLEKSKFN